MSIGGRWSAVAVALGAAALGAAPAQGALRIEKHLALAPGGRLVVKSEVGSVMVRGDAASGAAVVLTADRDDLEKDYEMTFEATPGEAQVIIKRRVSGWGWFDGWQRWRGRVDLTVSVPRATAASVHASGGRVEVSGLEGNTELSSSGGGVVAHELAAAWRRIRAAARSRCATCAAICTCRAPAGACGSWACAARSRRGRAAAAFTSIRWPAACAPSPAAAA